MEIDWSNVVTGGYLRVYPKLKCRISQYKRDGDSFKIGRTRNPTNRANQPDYSEYDEMILLYKTTSPNFVSEVEDALINDFREECENFNRGSGGPLGEPPYFIYVVRRRIRKQVRQP